MAALVIAHLIIALLAVVVGFGWTRAIASTGSEALPAAPRRARRRRGSLGPDPARATS